MNRIMRFSFVLLFVLLTAVTASAQDMPETCNIRPIVNGAVGDSIGAISTDDITISDTTGLHAMWDGQIVRWVETQFEGGYVALPCVIGVPVQDYSWMLDTPVNRLTQGAATMRTAPDDGATYMRDIPAGSGVQVLAVSQDGEAIRLLVRSQFATGWVNNEFAQINFDSTAVQLEWLSEPGFDAATMGNSFQVDDVNRSFFSPDGDNVVDLALVAGNIVFEGQTADPDESYHLVGAIRIDGEYSVLAFNGLVESSQGSFWSVRPDWDAAFDTTGQMLEHKSFAGELLVKSAYGFAQESPDTFYFGNLREFVAVDQAEVLAVPYASEVLGIDLTGQGGGSEAIVALAAADSANCPTEPTAYAVNGRNLGDGFYAASDIGPDEAPCFTMAVFVSQTDEEDQFTVMISQSAVDFTYARDTAIAIVFPESYGIEAINNWVNENLNQVRLDLGLSGRTTVNVLGLPSVTQIDLSSGQ